MDRNEMMWYILDIRGEPVYSIKTPASVVVRRKKEKTRSRSTFSGSSLFTSMNQQFSLRRGLLFHFHLPRPKFCRHLFSYSVARR